MSVKEMRCVVDMDEVKEFIRLAQNQESKHDQIANDLENAAKSGYLNELTRSMMLEASEKRSIVWLTSGMLCGLCLARQSSTK